MDEDWNRPTIPILRLFPGRPRRVFFSACAAFLGGMPLFFFAQTGAETWRVLRGPCARKCARAEKSEGGVEQGRDAARSSHRNRSPALIERIFARANPENRNALAAEFEIKPPPPLNESSHGARHGRHAVMAGMLGSCSGQRASRPCSTGAATTSTRISLSLTTAHAPTTTTTLTSRHAPAMRSVALAVLALCALSVNAQTVTTIDE